MKDAYASIPKNPAHLNAGICTNGRVRGDVSPRRELDDRWRCEAAADRRHARIEGHLVGGLASERGAASEQIRHHRVLRARVLRADVHCGPQHQGGDGGEAVEEDHGVCIVVGRPEGSACVSVNRGEMRMTLSRRCLGMSGMQSGAIPTRTDDCRMYCDEVE